MAQRPTQFPVFNTNDTDATAPSAALQSDGFPINLRPSRQVVNWLLNRIDAWLEYLDQSTFQPSDIFVDQAVSSLLVTTPLTGAGRAYAGGAFDGRAYVNGRSVGPVPNQAYTIPASSDSYWDLSEDGAWTVTDVSTGSGAPAVPANHTRVYMITTDATDRISVTLFAPTTGAAINRDLDSLAGIRVATGYLNKISAGRVLFQASSSGAIETRVYGLLTGGAIVLEATFNASWSGSQWVPDDGAVNSWLVQIGASGFRVALHTASAGNWSHLFTAGNWEIVSDVTTLGQDLYKRLTLSANPAATPDANALYKANIPKAWGIAETDGAGGVALLAGFNVSGVALAGGALEVTLDRTMVSANYAPICQTNAIDYVMSPGITSSSVCSFAAISHTTHVAVSLAGVAAKFFFQVMGDQ